MTKERNGWAKKLREELLPTLLMLEYYEEIGDVEAAPRRFCKAKRIFRKVRVCLRCGELYFHDSSPSVQMCDECDEEAIDEEATEELPEDYDSEAPGSTRISGILDL